MRTSLVIDVATAGTAGSDLPITGYRIDVSRITDGQYKWTSPGLTLAPRQDRTRPLRSQSRYHRGD